MSKYGAIKQGRHASRKESRRAADLALEQKLGLISDLEEQIKFELIPKQPAKDGMPAERAVTYTCDFRYKRDGIVVIEDSKGMKTQQYILRRKMLRYFHGIAIKET